MPKQYLPLQGQPIALYSLDVFAAMREVGELVVVCDPSYDDLFREHHAHLPAQRPPLVFARPGAERQDSVSNGFKVRRPLCMYQMLHGVPWVHSESMMSGMVSCMPDMDFGQDIERNGELYARHGFWTGHLDCPHYYKPELFPETYGSQLAACHAVNTSYYVCTCLSGTCALQRLAPGTVLVADFTLCLCSLELLTCAACLCVCMPATLWVLTIFARSRFGGVTSLSAGAGDTTRCHAGGHTRLGAPAGAGGRRAQVHGRCAAGGHSSLASLCTCHMAAREQRLVAEKACRTSAVRSGVLPSQQQTG